MRRPDTTPTSTADLATMITEVEREMHEAARALRFEEAALLRDELVALRAMEHIEPAGSGLIPVPEEALVEAASD